MTNSDIESKNPVPGDATEERKRRILLLVLLLLLLLICSVSVLFLRYVLKPEPITDIIPIGPSAVSNPPNYVFSITRVDSPVGVAFSEMNKRIYVVESAGERLIKAFDLDGKFLFDFAPPGTDKASRLMSYIAVDGSGQVYVVDRKNGAIDKFDADGNFLDAIIGLDLTASKFLAGELGGSIPDGTTFYFIGGLSRTLFYTLPGEAETSVKIPKSDLGFNPLGIRFDKLGNLLYTNVTEKTHDVQIITADVLAKPWSEFSPKSISFGSMGTEAGQFSFPQVTLLDSKGNVYVTDGNNGRISVWTADLHYSSFFGFGSTESSLNLPRGAWMDDKDHLFVADAVGAMIRVYDVSGAEPLFLYNFGGFGVGEGFFNYPYDISLDGTGRLFIADRGNNRIQVWSY